MTLGPAIALLPLLERARGRLADLLATFGRVPMFYYVIHFWMAHTLAAIAAAVRYGSASLAFLFSPLPSMGGSRTLFPPDFGYPLWVAYAAVFQTRAAQDWESQRLSTTHVEAITGRVTVVRGPGWLWWRHRVDADAAAR